MSFVNVYIPRDLSYNPDWCEHDCCLHGCYHISKYNVGSLLDIPLHNIIITECLLSCDCTTYHGSLLHAEQAVGRVTVDAELLRLPTDSKKNASILMSPSLAVKKIIINNKLINHENIRIIYYDMKDIESCNLYYIQNILSSDFKDLNNYDPIEYLTHFIKIRNSNYQKPNRWLLHLIMGFVIKLVPFLSVCQLNIRHLEQYIHKITGYRSIALQHIDVRFDQIIEACKCIDGISSINSNKTMSVHTSQVVALRLLVMICIDLMLGIAAAALLMHYWSIESIYLQFTLTTQWMSSNVLTLLEWLRGAPAGLKLNQPLTKALATFFSYHVGLWTLYLDVAEDAVQFLLKLLLYCGVFGASLQLAFLCDLLHVVTLHIHCFYIYAARLHMVQVSLLGSQWRAFRGHKWNPLKERVDSLYDDCDGEKNQCSSRVWPGPSSQSLSRVITAVVFTLALFLLPTTTVYYSVFLLLRVLLYVSRYILLCITWLLHFNPLGIVLMHIVGSNALKGQLYLEAHLPQDSEPNCFNLKVLQCSLFDAITRSSHNNTLPPLDLPNLRSVLNSMLYAKDLL